jgi:putative nucleotidyltransferase with HDIG domain
MGPLAGFRSSLTYPIVAILVLVTVVPVAVVGLLLASSNREHISAREEQYLTREADSLAKSISLFVHEHRTSLESVAVALQTGGRFDVSSSGPAGVLLEKIASVENRHFLFLQISNREGEATYIQAPQLTPEILTTLADNIRQGHEAALSGEPWERQFLELPSPAPPVSIIAYGLRSRSGTRWGTLVGVIDFSRLRQNLTRTAYGGLLASIIDSSGSVLLTSEPTLGSLDVSESPLVSDFLKTPLALTRVYRHPSESVEGTVLGSIAPVNWAGWGVILERPVDEAFEIVEVMQFRTMVVSGITAVIALVVGMIGGRKLIRRVQTLAGVTTEISDGNFEVRATVSGKDEISQLANNFNNMAGSIEALVRRLRHALRQNQELFLETIRTLATAIDAKDPYTRGHSERVSSYSMAIARHLGLNQDEVFRIRIAAILHDVGKLGIRDGILNKPGGLTDDEFAIMRRHAEIGAQIMSPIRMLKDIIPGIRNHHETWDGKGYPDGIRGEGIPLVARIIGAADTFDAMTTTRPYQKAMTLDYVMGKMQAMSGSRFDPQVVLALEAAVQAGDITPPSDQKVEQPEEVT